MTLNNVVSPQHQHQSWRAQPIIIEKRKRKGGRRIRSIVRSENSWFLLWLLRSLLSDRNRPSVPPHLQERHYVTVVNPLPTTAMLPCRPVTVSFGWLGGNYRDSGSRHPPSKNTSHHRHRHRPAFAKPSRPASKR